MVKQPLAAIVREFCDVRMKGDPELLRPFLAGDVRWCEPEVGTHMGVLNGADAVIDMIARALETTGGTFQLQVVEAVETATHCSAVIGWSAQKGPRTITGREMAVFGFQNAKIREAYFFPANVADDEAFWD